MNWSDKCMNSKQILKFKNGSKIEIAEFQKTNTTVEHLNKFDFLKECLELSL